MEIFHNGTIIEDDSISEVIPGKVLLGMIKPTYKEKYEGLLTEFSWLDSEPKVVSPVKN
jgi:rhamnogalacturonyl hydrolase YesR